MAREQITHNHIVERPLPPAVEYPAGHPGELIEAIAHIEEPRHNLHVQWDRDPGGFDGHVQIAIDWTVAELRELLAFAEAEAAAAAASTGGLMPVEGGAEVVYDTDNHQVRVYSDVLTRHEINKAINALRRGRDVAYGKDA